MAKTQQKATEHMASAKSMNLPISTKQSVEISREIRYKSTSFAKDFMEHVIAMKKPVAFKRFNNDMGHKAGMAAGRFPVKAASYFLKLLKSVEANAQDKGLNVSNLKITKVISNKASIPSGGGRNRHGTKRTHIEIEVQELVGKKKDAKKGAQKTEKVEAKVDDKSSEPVKKEVKEEVKKETPVEVKETKTEEKVVETPKTEEKKSDDKPVETKVEETTESKPVQDNKGDKE